MLVGPNSQSSMFVNFRNAEPEQKSGSQISSRIPDSFGSSSKIESARVTREAAHLEGVDRVSCLTSRCF